MNIFTIPNTEIKIIVAVGDYSKDNCDVVINWMSPYIFDSPSCFVKLKENAGELFYSTILPYKDNVNYFDSFTTHAGLLPATIICNTVYAPVANRYNEAFFKIKETLLTYGKNNLCRFLSITAPDKDLNKFVHYLVLYLQQVNTLKEIRIFVDEEKDCNQIIKELSSHKKSKFKNILYQITKAINEITRNKRPKL